MVASHSLSADELRTVVAEAGALIPLKHQQMLVGILDLERIEVEEIMIPRADILGIDLQDDWELTLDRLRDSPHTRLPLYDGDLDHIIGILHMKKVAGQLARGELDRDLLLSLARAREPYYIPEGTTLTQQLLAFGRKSERHSTLVDLNQVAVDLTRMLGRLIGERIQLRLALDPSLDLVLVDRGHVEQVILNLVVNARDAMPEGGDCTIETRPAMREDLLAAGIRDGAGWVSLSVVDEGVGMTDDVRGQVFEPFFTTKPPGQGTGLGLATVHGLVAANGGQIVVHSAPGRGSRFTVLFPVAGTRASADRTVPGVATVLVVDDDERLIGALNMHDLFRAKVI